MKRKAKKKLIVGGLGIAAVFWFWPRPTQAAFHDRNGQLVFIDIHHVAAVIRSPVRLIGDHEPLLLTEIWLVDQETPVLVREEAQIAANLIGGLTPLELSPPRRRSPAWGWLSSKAVSTIRGGIKDSQGPLTRVKSGRHEFTVFENPSTVRAFLGAL